MAFAALTRFWRLDYPAKMYFDEVYHVPAAMTMASGDFITAFDPYVASYDGEHTIDWLHPPLAKYFQASSMALFGKHPIAWRLPSVLFSLFSILLFYGLLRMIGERFLFTQFRAKRQILTQRLALVGAFLLSIDGILLPLSRIAMNDVVVLCFTLLAVLLYVFYLDRQRDYYLLGVGFALGLALASKWSAGWLITALLLHQLWGKPAWHRVPYLLFVFLGIPSFVYCLSYVGAFLQGMTLGTWFDLQQLMLQSQLHNPYTHAYSSGPLAWILNWRSVWLYGEQQTFVADGFVAQSYVIENPLLVWYMLWALLLSVRFLIVGDLGKKERKVIVLLLLLYCSMVLPWLLIDRILFLHHYLLAIPFGLALVSYQLVCWSQLPGSKPLHFFYSLFWPAWVFLLFYPHWTALPVPIWFADVVYFTLPSWR